MAKSRVDTERLRHAILRARLSLRRFREERARAVRQYVGDHWGEESDRKEHPVNLLSLYVRVITRSLIAKNPRFLLSTFKKEHKPAVAAMQTWANVQVEKMRLDMTLQRVVVDALFSVGVCKVGLATPADSAASGWNLPAGQPFAERVDLDDLVFDVHARDFSEVEFIGHRYRCRKSVADRLFRRNLPTSEDSAYNLEGDERLTALQRLPFAQSEREFEPHVDLWEIYVPHERQVLTLLDDGLSGPDAGRPLKAQEWVGPDHGPYHVLGFGPVPGNAMFKGVIPDLINLDDGVNTIYRKLIRQGERQKEILAVLGGADEDGQRVVDSSDGEAIRMDDPKSTQTFGFGGPNQQNMLLVGEMIQRFSWLAGNLDILGGLSPQSKTATQDQLLAQNSSGTVADMQDRAVTLAGSVGKALCWYWWQHPTQVMHTAYRLPGMPEFEVPQQVHPRGGQGSLRRDAGWDDLAISVDPYSVQHATPQSRVQNLMQVIQQLQPLMPVMAQQGIMIDMNALLTKLAAYLDMPDLAEILTVMTPPEASASGGSGGGPSMPRETTRNYVRESMPGRTMHGNQLNMMNTLAGGGGQNGNGQQDPSSQSGG